MPRRTEPDPLLPVVITRERARAAGLTVDQIRQRVRSGRWRSVARGVYVRADAGSPQGDRFAAARQEHAYLAVAEAHRRPGSVVVGASAAAIHEIPLFSRLPPYATLVRMGEHPRRQSHARILGWPIADEDITRTRPRLTTPARTWFDIARTMSFADGLVAGDHLLRELMVTRDDLVAVTERGSVLRGAKRCRQLLKHVSPQRESPLESASWAYFLEHRLPLPAMQVSIRDAMKKFVARVDFLWEERNLVGECDGRLKYVTGEDLYAEKRREDALRTCGFSVARWGMDDLKSPALAHRLRALLP